MLIEVAILRGEHGALHIERHVSQRDATAGRVAEPADLRRAVGVVDDRRLGAGDLVGVGHRREEDSGRKSSGTEQAEEEQGEEGASDPAPLAARLLSLRPGVPAALGCHGVLLETAFHDHVPHPSHRPRHAAV